MVANEDHIQTICKRCDAVVQCVRLGSAPPVHSSACAVTNGRSSSYSPQEDQKKWKNETSWELGRTRRSGSSMMVEVVGAKNNELSEHGLMEALRFLTGINQ